MFKKTSGIDFLKYGEVFNETDGKKGKQFSEGNHKLPVENKDLIFLYKANEDVYFRTLEGITLLVVSEDLNQESFQTFVVHRVVKVKAGIYFNFIALSDTAFIELATTPTTIMQNYFFDQTYVYHRITPKFKVHELIADYYNVRSTNYHFNGEYLPFWEITYVDSGTLYTVIDGTEYVLNQNQIIIAPPGVFQEQHTKDKPCSYLTIIARMEVDPRYNDIIFNTVHMADRNIKRIIEDFVKADSDESDTSADNIIVILEALLATIVQNTKEPSQRIASTPMQQKFENELLEQIILYINENIFTSFNVEDLCDQFAISRSSLQSLFKANLNIAPKEYISNLKLQKSKELIKESKYTISEIASMLGFSSIHYFSRRFKQKFDINTTEYANKLIKS